MDNKKTVRTIRRYTEQFLTRGILTMCFLILMMIVPYMKAAHCGIEGYVIYLAGLVWGPQLLTFALYAGNKNNGFTSLTLGWLSTPILIEKCTQGKSSGAFLVFQGAFLKKRGAFFGESGAFLKAGCIFPRVGCISEKQGAFWEDKVHCYYLFLKPSLKPFRISVRCFSPFDTPDLLPGAPGFLRPHGSRPMKKTPGDDRRKRRGTRESTVAFADQSIICPGSFRFDPASWSGGSRAAS